MSHSANMWPMTRTRQEVGKLLRKFRLEKKLSRQVLADAMGVHHNTIQKWEEGERAISLENLSKLSDKLGRPLSDFMGAASENEQSTKIVTIPSKNRPPSPNQSSRLLTVNVVGDVQAGVWREAVEWPADRHYGASLPVSEQYWGLKPYAAEVLGPSMDELFPHGSLVVVVPFINLSREPRNGELVVAMRSRATSEWEVTVKEYRIDRQGKAWLWPRSTHPGFQTPIAADEAEPGEELVITGLVVGSYRSHA